MWRDDEVVVTGVNTARSLTWKGGRINRAQVDQLRERLCGLGENVVSVVVAHHPFELPPGEDEDLVGRARMAIAALAECDLDLLMSGHLHRHHIAQSAERYRTPAHDTIIIQAGTATSTRVRGQPNSFNVVTVADPRLDVEAWIWHSDAWARATVEEMPPQSFVREGPVWRPLA